MESHPIGYLRGDPAHYTEKRPGEGYVFWGTHLMCAAAAGVDPYTASLSNTIPYSQSEQLWHGMLRYKRLHDSNAGI